MSSSVPVALQRTAAGSSGVPGQDVVRSAEMSFLNDLLAGIHGGGRAVLVRGEPGIGKSWLLDRALDLARGAGRSALRTTGTDGIAPEAFSGLSDLLRPLQHRIPLLPPVQRQALRTAFGSSSGPPPEMFLVALATLTLLADEAAVRPVVVIVDDLHWVDGPTNDVLSFLGRRLADDPILLLCGVRTGAHVALADGDAEVLDLSGLDEASSRLLLEVRPALSEPVRAAILDVARGNPLALIELPAGWADPDPAGLPLSARLEQAFGDHVRAMPALTRDALLVAALSRGEELAPVIAGASVLARQRLTAAVLEPAQAAGILHFDAGVVHFRHPLVRSAVVLAEPAARRQAAHAALATVFDGQPSRGTWHRAAAVDGPDDEVADALERQHRVSAQRGDVMAAIAGLERAAQLTSDPARRGQRLLLAAHHAYGLGRADLVDRLVGAAAGTGLTALDQARAQWLREIFDDGDPGDADRVMMLCDIALAAQAAGDGELAVNLVLSAAGRCWWVDTGRRARARVVQVADALDGFQDDPRCVAAVAVAEPVLRGDDVLRRLSRFGAESVPDADHLRLLGMAARAVGDEPRAADFLDRAETALRVQGRLGHLSHVLALQGAVQVDLGDWPRAVGSGQEALQLGRDTGQPVWAGGVGLLQARLNGLQGRVSAALEGAAQVDVSPELRGISQFRACAQLARGIAWISAGRHADAVAALLPLFDPTDPRHHQREQLSGIMYLAEAAVRCEQHDVARGVLARMESIAQVTASPLLATQLLYARAVLADDSDAEALYRGALAHDLSQWPWIRARLQLAYGSWLRRQRRHAESREPLRLALATFSLIGATTWTAQAHAELRSAGERFEPSEQLPPADLSPQELQVARLAAAGLSNREIGVRLFLSPRTVASHLYRIFPRLGIRSRGQLGLLFGADPAPAAGAAIRPAGRRDSG